MGKNSLENVLETILRKNCNSAGSDYSKNRQGNFDFLWTLKWNLALYFEIKKKSSKYRFSHMTNTQEKSNPRTSISTIISSYSKSQRATNVPKALVNFKTATNVRKAWINFKTATNVPKALINFKTATDVPKPLVNQNHVSSKIYVFPTRIYPVMDVPKALIINIYPFH
jgi:hypothetical protein